MHSHDGGDARRADALPNGDQIENQVDRTEVTLPDDSAERRLRETAHAVAAPVQHETGDDATLADNLDRAAMERQHDALDRAVLVRLEQRFAHDVAEQRLKQLSAAGMHFESSADYHVGLRTAYPEDDINGVVGDVRADGVHVDSQRTDLPTVVAHERLHELSDPRFRQTFGREMDEGTTELLAADSVPRVDLADGPMYYPEQKALAELLAARVGPELEHAYLSGDLQPLRDALDGQLGDGTLSDLAELTTQERLEEAQALLKRRR